MGGFVWDSSEFVFNQKLIPALHSYRQQYGDLDVPQAWRMSDTTDVPRILRNFSLGQTVNKIRSSGAFVKRNETRRAVLNEMGFVWDYDDFVFNEMILPALHVYRQHFGDLDVPQAWRMNDTTD